MSSKQVVLITGTSTGFGRLFTETLARKGHTVFATMRDPGGRNAKNASEIRALAEKDSLPIHTLELDVTDDASVQQTVDAAVAKAGRIDVAINNAGYYLTGLEEAVTTEQARRLMDTNFLGPVRVNRAVLPHMRRQRSGVLIHISSVAGRVVLPGVGFYCASKFALEALAETYNYELAGQGIESVIVEPAQYETSIFGSNLTGADEARANTYGAVKEIPAKINAALSSTAGNAQEVADVVLRIVETPAGEKQLRYVVSPQSIGVDEINALTKQVQANVLEAFGLAADTKFLKGKAAGSV
jgi:NAD(P)-dependent dehydrogenase (short-subunit alcohol dehydrogenase family)